MITIVFPVFFFITLIMNAYIKASNVASKCQLKVITLVILAFLDNTDYECQHWDYGSPKNVYKSQLKTIGLVIPAFLIITYYECVH